MTAKFLDSYLDGLSPLLEILVNVVVWALIICLFYGLNKLLKERRRIGIIALILGILAPGSGFAYSAAFKRAWAVLVLLIISLLLVYFNQDKDLYTYVYAIIFFGQAILSATYAERAQKALRKKKYDNNQKAMENAYFQDLQPYIQTGHHLAVDTNFLMHFHEVLIRIFKETNIHLFLHPTVFGELEGLKKNNNRTVRADAQIAFDIIEMYQKANRMQWTRKQMQGGNFSSADQRIVTGVLSEIKRGVKLVFASHDKGARILARSLQIPVIDPLGNENEKVKNAALRKRRRGIES
mgnify:CR=1 FL=1